MDRTLLKESWRGSIHNKQHAGRGDKEDIEVLEEKEKRSCEKEETAWSFLISWGHFILSVYIFCCVWRKNMQSHELKKNGISTLKLFIIKVKRG